MVKLIDGVFHKIGKEKMKLLKIIVLSSVLMGGAAYAHHGSNGQFDSSVRVNVTGEVTKVSMANPHAYVYFDVAGKDGETIPWRCEMRAGSMLRRTGWTAEMFAPGTKISIEGAQARREEHGCMLTTITFADGVTYQRNQVIEAVVAAKAQVAKVELSGEVPNINGNWVAPQRERRARPTGGAAGGGMGAPAAGGMGAPAAAAGGMGAPRGGRGGGYEQTAVGLAAGEGFNREMNPRFHCEATNIFHDFWFDQMVNKFEQTDDKIVISYGFMDIVRTIHLDMDEHPADLVPSRAGHSIGQWEGNTLVVKTVGFEPGYLAATFAGVKHGEQLQTTERFTVAEDGKSLTQKYEGNDAEYLTASFSGEQVVNKTDAEFYSFECEDLTEEIVKGF